MIFLIKKKIDFFNNNYLFIFTTNWCYYCKFIKKKIFFLKKKIKYLFININIDFYFKYFKINFFSIPFIYFVKKNFLLFKNLTIKKIINFYFLFI